MAMTLWIPFMDNVNRLFQKRFCYSQISAGNAITIPYIFAVILSVPLGLAVDKYGQRRHLSILGLVVFLSAQLIMLLYPQCDGE
jgi:MFS family permease